LFLPHLGGRSKKWEAIDGIPKNCNKSATFFVILFAKAKASENSHKFTYFPTGKRFCFVEVIL
jgi:hypothetical protein